LTLNKKNFKGNKFRLSRDKDFKFYDAKTLDQIVVKIDEVFLSRTRWQGDPMVDPMERDKATKASPQLTRSFNQIFNG
jgi:hypothetical protein